MKIEESQVRRLTISEVPNLDHIRVILEDIGPGQGRINIECYGRSWANYWGGMGKENTLAGFLCGCDEHYIAGKLSSIPSQVFDPDALKDSLKRDLIDSRRKGYISAGHARKAFDEIEDTALPESEQECWTMSVTMQSLLGDEWWYRLPKKTNPDYDYLTRIIKTVQVALRESCGGEK